MTLYYLLKVLISILLVIIITEISKRNSMYGGLLASLPIISILAFFWLYIDTKDIEKVISLAYSIFWLVLPSLILFISLPLLLKVGVSFYISIFISISLTIISYSLMLLLFNFLGIKL